ncbi:MAG: hypothetical protein Kow0075_08900 [Salibacteraceae bacterium]
MGQDYFLIVSKMKYKSVYWIGVLSLFLGCSKSKQNIEYGKDNCHLCQMRIMDPKFGAEAITDKGRCYKFDSVECLLNYLNESEAEHSHVFVTDFEQPGSLIDAQSAYFLVSKNMPSPMGGYLSAFSDVNAAEYHRSQKTGEIYTWEEIKALYQK